VNLAVRRTHSRNWLGNKTKSFYCLWVLFIYICPEGLDAFTQYPQLSVD